MVLVAGKKSVQATLGANCRPNPDGTPGGPCVDSKYPLKTSGNVTLHGGDTVTLLLGAPAGYVGWRAARIDGAGKEQITAVGEGKPATKTQKRWRLILPQKLSTRTKLLGFDVYYRNAYSSFEVGSIVKRAPAKK
jgi:hypothetical protein